jgi:predicted AAA+ superfamily ATPase
MLQVTENEIKSRLAFDNPWWDIGRGIDERLPKLPERAYLPQFLDLVRDRSVRRAVVLMGLRRVGKTVMLYQTVQKLLADGVEPKTVFYVSLDNPIYVGMSLEKLVTLFRETHGHPTNAQLTVLFDEVQYLKGWEVHLKSLVDSYLSIKFVASGSAAAALKMKSNESGAGRFTDFLLPPLTFAEFLRFRGFPDDMEIDALNREFIAYLNYGGFPEAVVSPSVQQNMTQFVGNDIIDKVLLRDLPSLYGIDDPQELRRFFAVVAYNTGQEVNLDGLSKASGAAKNTIRKFIEYLEAAFLERFPIGLNRKRGRGFTGGWV